MNYFSKAGSVRQSFQKDIWFTVKWQVLGKKYIWFTGVIRLLSLDISTVLLLLAEYGSTNSKQWPTS
jgi:hypothetical protein